jgi:hypothetical protein
MPDEGQERRGRPWGRAISASALGTLNLVVGGTGLVAAAGLHSLPLLALGGAAYAALVAWDLANPETWRKAAREERDPTESDELPIPGSLSDPQLQRAALALGVAHRELERVRRESPSSVARYLEVALVSAGQLDQGAARLLRRGEELYRYLATQDLRKVREEIQALDAQAERTPDESAREQFKAARASRDQQLATLLELSSALDRVHANVARIVAAAEGLPARVVHMRALDRQAVDAMSGDVNGELDRLNQEVASFEETLKSLSGRVPA